MKELKFYKTLIWVVVVVNLLLILFFTLIKPNKHKPPHSRPDFGQFKFQDRLIKQLDLDENQTKIFKMSAEKHHNNVKDIQADQAELLSQYIEERAFENLNNDSLLNQILSLEKDKIETTLQHFEEVREAFEPGQMEKYETFLDVASKHLILKNRISRN